MIKNYVWVTQLGDSYYLKDLTDGHLDNIIKAYRKNKLGRKEYWWPKLIEEKRRRLALKSKIGQIIYGKG